MCILIIKIRLLLQVNNCFEAYSKTVDVKPLPKNEFFLFLTLNLLFHSPYLYLKSFAVSTIELTLLSRILSKVSFTKFCSAFFTSSFT